MENLSIEEIKKIIEDETKIEYLHNYFRNVFGEEFTQKYIDKTLSIEDLAVLPDDQLQHLSDIVCNYNEKSSEFYPNKQYNYDNRIFLPWNEMIPTSSNLYDNIKFYKKNKERYNHLVQCSQFIIKNINQIQKFNYNLEKLDESFYSRTIWTYVLSGNIIYPEELNNTPFEDKEIVEDIKTINNIPESIREKSKNIPLEDTIKEEFLEHPVFLLNDEINVFDKEKLYRIWKLYPNFLPLVFENPQARRLISLHDDITKYISICLTKIYGVNKMKEYDHDNQFVYLNTPNSLSDYLNSPKNAIFDGEFPYQYEYNYKHKEEILNEFRKKTNCLENPQIFKPLFELLSQENMRPFYNTNNIEDFAIVGLLELYKKNKLNIMDLDKDNYIKRSIPEMFISDDASDEIKAKYYNSHNIINEIDEKDLLYFSKDNLVFYSQLESIDLSDIDFDLIDKKTLLTLLKGLKNTNSMKMQKTIIDSLTNKNEEITLEKVEKVIRLAQRLEYSNSIEIRKIKETFITELLDNDHAEELLEEIENIFLDETLPYTGKTFKVFNILYGDLSELTKNGSPILKSHINSRKQTNLILFNDLLKCNIYSNNRNLNKYIKKLQRGEQIHNFIKSNLIREEDLTEEDARIYEMFYKSLLELYNNSVIANITGETLSNSENLELLKVPEGSSITDRIINMFGHYIGITSLNEYENARDNALMKSRIKNIENSRKLEINPGDLIKGVDINYIEQILGNGSVSKEFLTTSSLGPDLTPLDTDLSKIQVQGTFEEQLENNKSKGYGPPFLILKYDTERFNLTRDEVIKDNENLEEIKNINAIKDNKLELFKTLSDTHYGIRTGFPSSEIDYIISDKNFDTIKIAEVVNNIYIPIYNYQGELEFSIEEFDMYRSKMAGLSEYDMPLYKVSPTAYTKEAQEISETLNESVNDATRKRNAIISYLEPIFGQKFTPSISGNLKPGTVQFIDTGSTGRGTNVIGDCDFDFMVKLDNDIFENPSKMNDLRERLQKALKNSKSQELTSRGDIRYKEVSIPGLDETVDIDLTFTTKTNEIVYSTDMCVKDRLSNIPEEERAIVIGNIVQAKHLLKSIEAYKPQRNKEKPQGGLGGIGVENWILQNGGSLIDAINEFMTYASIYPTFQDFQQHYKIWDFGENHMARGNAHDNFVNNMSEEGFNKMVACFQEILDHEKKEESSKTK